MTFIIYKIIEYAEGTQAMSVIRGILVVLLITQLSDWLGLTTVNYVLKNIMTVGFIAIIVMFQPELRRALYKLGGTKFRKTFFGFLFKDETNEELDRAIDEIVSAAANCAATKTGMLVVIERETKLDDIVETGIALDSYVSRALLLNIFTPNTPLHDGAVVISSYNYRIRAASCLLPLSRNNNLNTEIGTRHRSAIGMSEVADCVCVVVSEETGTISYATEGKITRYLTAGDLKKVLSRLLSVGDEAASEEKEKVSEAVDEEKAQ